MSDHDICFSTQELCHAKTPKSEVYTRKITEAKSQTFCELLSAADWSQVTTSSQPIDAFDKLHLNLEECYNEAFPLCNSSFNKRIMQLTPGCLRPCWWVEGLRNGYMWRDAKKGTLDNTRNMIGFTARPLELQKRLIMPSSSRPTPAVLDESSNCPIEERKGKLVCSFNMERRTSRGKYNYIITEKKLFRNNVLFLNRKKNSRKFIQSHNRRINCHEMLSINVCRRKNFKSHNRGINFMDFCP